MRTREDVRLTLRWILGRPVETLLLVLGIALGIGATADGIALAGRARAQSIELLSSTQYREIVVTVREDAADMDVPATKATDGATVVLTTEDLAARSDAEDVQYAYVSNRTGMRLGEFGPPPDAPQAEGGQASADAGSTGGDVAQPQPPQQPQVTLDGPQPTVEEIQGYEVTPEFFPAWDLQVAQGSLFTTADMQKGEPLLILGATLAGTLFEDGESLGRQVLSRNELYRIVGILEPTGTAYDGMAFTTAAMAELQGLGAAARMRPDLNTSLHFTVGSSTRLEQAKAQLASWFEQKYGAGKVVVSVPRDEAETARDRTSRLVTVILFLALSALLIAAANVTNILFGRAMRKRRAVGVLKALGATQGGIFRLFFREALIIGVGGAVVGAGLSVLMSRLMQATTGFAAVYVGLLALGIVGASTLVTALDILPALQAARVPASEAIRYE